MQPLISPIDHESRTNSYRAEDEPRTSEASPLLQRFPRRPVQEEQRYQTTMAVTLLFLVLFAGILIGIYLLVIQNRSENVLPPVEQLVLMGSQVIVVETGTRQCYGTSDCAKLLNAIQATNTSSIPYNFMISSDGETFEALGWRRRSPLFPQYSADVLVLAFIGESPKLKRASTYQVKFPLNVWAALIDNILIGPIILPRALTGERFLELLRDKLPLLLEYVPLQEE
ncbi:unnamed protein product [Parnassius apollo]|uniref:(apollo) hypothetical protein n=1 Tax=Parnassius apollo TaxID=110799 RepID=A0A8S3W3Z7_PARAO|nr:unnamed protein product [Parnassius apollo]